MPFPPVDPARLDAVGIANAEQCVHAGCLGVVFPSVAVDGQHERAVILDPRHIGERHERVLESGGKDRQITTLSENFNRILSFCA